MLLNRRTLFTTMGAGILALAGCAVGDPRVSEPSSRWTPSATPSAHQPPAVQAAVDREIALTQHATSVSAIADDHAAVITSIADAHQSHAVVLATAFGPVTTPTPSASATPTDWTTALTQWQTTLAEAATAHLDDSLATSGHLGLVLASCAAFAGVAAQQVTALPITIGTSEPADFVPVEDTAALSALIAQVHAARYAYQTALGAFQLSDERRGPLARREVALSQLRDDLSEALVARGVAPPAAEPAYDVRRPDTVEAAIALTAELEERLLPFVGQAVAGLLAGDALRPTAVRQLSATTERLVAAGGTLPRWPGC